ncbi:hypothetical protein [Marinicella meishanensis]|uniref:hypothetical protein n=1 Tax=Marinicella meishanensis TaxID=2873263 RepID=UPI001CBE1411|nr:hypothetical protein [Marinicella sp. NBU2979]
MCKHSKLYSAMVLAGIIGVSESREIYYQEDFSGGAIPFGWITDDLSGQNAFWTYCADPTTGQSNGCPPLWDDGLNQQGPFASSSANNGFMTLDSDIYGNLPQNHVSTLTAGPFNLSGASSVHVEFQGFIGAYTVVPANNAVFQVSNDGGNNWTTYAPYPNLTLGTPDPPNVRWSYNPTFSSFDVSAVAAGQSGVFMRFSWTGNFEFLWSVDDFVVASLPDLIFTDGMEEPPPPP